jgi:hypothetical protein
MGAEGSQSGVQNPVGFHHEMEDRKLKGKSAVRRQKIEETGLVRNVCSQVSLSASNGRVGIGSSVKSYSGVVEQVSIVAI